MDEKLYAVAISLLSSPAKLNIWDQVRQTEPKELYARLLQVEDLSVQAYIAKEYSNDPLETARRIIEKTNILSVRLVDFWDPGYPRLLKQISKPPIVLYVKGAVDLNKKTMAIVGTRKADQRSLAITARITEDLCRNGFVIASGMAVGIDRAAHETALDNNGGTIGVMANGIDIHYPAANQDIYKRIEQSPYSATISEYPPGNRADRWTFSRRNRIISGLSIGTVIIKAGQKSGAMITANHAIEQNREVFVCPGFAFDENYSGCHSLIKSGAKLISTTYDIMEELGDLENKSLNPAIKNNENNNKQGELFTHEGVEKEIMDYLRNGECDINNLLYSVKRHIGEINEAIMNLELEGVLVRKGNIISRME